VKRCEMADVLQRRCDGLYEDAIDRMHRLKEKKMTAEERNNQEAAELQRLSSARMRDYRRGYRFNDSRSHIEREEEHLRRREQNLLRLKDEQDCDRSIEFSIPDDFRANGSLSGQRSPSTAAASSDAGGSKGFLVNGKQKSHTVPDPTRLRKLVEKQLMISRKMAELDTDVRKERALLTARRVELEEKIFAEEEDDMRFQAMEQSIIGHRTKLFDEGMQNDLAEEVQRKVMEVLGPEQKVKELRLYQRKLEIIHELERMDLQVLKLSKSDRKALMNMGYKLQLSEDFRKVMLAESAAIADCEDSQILPSIELGDVDMGGESDPQCGNSLVLVQEDVLSSPVESPVSGVRYTYGALPKSETSTAPDWNVEADAGAANHFHISSTSTLLSVPTDDIIVGNKVLNQSDNSDKSLTVPLQELSPSQPRNGLPQTLQSPPSNA